MDDSGAWYCRCNHLVVLFVELHLLNMVADAGSLRMHRQRLYDP
jgi:hypothetical protein